jgi:hypothetical protein
MWICSFLEFFVKKRENKFYSEEEAKAKEGRSRSWMVTW